GHGRKYNGGQRGCQDRVLHLDSPMSQAEAMTVLLRRTDDHWGLRPGTGSGGKRRASAIDVHLAPVAKSEVWMPTRQRPSSRKQMRSRNRARSPEKTSSSSGTERIRSDRGPIVGEPVTSRW